MLNLKDYYESQVEWCEEQVRWYTKEIDWVTERIKKSRSDDREIEQYIWNKGPLTRVDMQVFGGGNFTSRETKELLKERRRYYNRRKKYTQDADKYKAKLQAV